MRSPWYNKQSIQKLKLKSFFVYGFFLSGQIFLTFSTEHGSHAAKCWNILWTKMDDMSWQDFARFGFKMDSWLIGSIAFDPCNCANRTCYPGQAITGTTILMPYF